MNVTDLPRRLQLRIDVRPEGYDSPCWMWTGADGGNGYGMSSTYDRTTKTQRLWKAHRLTYTLLVNVIPEGMWIDHLCLNRRCVNPAHLEVVTPGENLRRAHGRLSVDHCKNGHDLRETAIPNGNGRGRRCGVCKNAWARARRRAA